MRSIVSLSPPASRRLCTIEEVRVALGLDQGEIEEIASAIDVACRELSSAAGMGRDPWRQRIAERLVHLGGLSLQLSAWPIEAGTVAVAISGVEVSPTIYEPRGAAPERPNRLHRSDGWPASGRRHGDAEADYLVTYTGGWLMPDQVTPWVDGGSWSLGQFIRPSTAALYLFEVTTAGVGGSPEPTWPTTLGGTVGSAAATFTARAVFELPADLRRAARLAAIAIYEGASVPVGIRRERVGNTEIEYEPQGSTHVSLIPDACMHVARLYR